MNKCWYTNSIISSKCKIRWLFLIYFFREGTHFLTSSRKSRASMPQRNKRWGRACFSWSSGFRWKAVVAAMRL